MLLGWTGDLAVGHAEIDRDHQELVGMVNRLYDAIQRDQGHLILDEIFNALAKYTQEHFKREEELMRRIGYADFYRHKKQHEKLLQQLNEIAAKHGANRSVTIETMQFLKDWLTIHIQQDDAKLAEALSR